MILGAEWYFADAILKVDSEAVRASRLIFQVESVQQQWIWD
jgi:hypothetical protein